MQTSLVLLAVKIRPPEFEDGPVIPPEEEADRALKQIRHNNKRPELGTKDVLRCELHKRRDILPLIVEARASNNVDRDQDATSNDGNNDEDIPDHAEKPQEQDCIESDRFHKVLLLDLDRIQPTKRLLIQRKRPVLLVGMFGARRIDARVARTQKAKDEEEESGDSEGVDNGGVD